MPLKARPPAAVPGIGDVQVTRLVPLSEIEPRAVEQLLDHAFGTDRHSRTAYRVRAGARPVPELGFAALDDDGALLGTIQCWPVALRCDSGESLPMLMVGPVAVEPHCQREGIGRALMAEMLAAADALDAPGSEALMMIGDPEYYGRFFSFTADHTARWRLPGPFEPRRLLARGAQVRDCAGEVGPRELKAAA